MTGIYTIVSLCTHLWKASRQRTLTEEEKVVFRLSSLRELVKFSKLPHYMSSEVRLAKIHKSIVIYVRY